MTWSISRTLLFNKSVCLWSFRFNDYFSLTVVFHCLHSNVNAPLLDSIIFNLPQILSFSRTIIWLFNQFHDLILLFNPRIYTGIEYNFHTFESSPPPSNTYFTILFIRSRIFIIYKCINFARALDNLHTAINQIMQISRNRLKIAHFF